MQMDEGEIQGYLCTPTRAKQDGLTAGKYRQLIS